jgi:hypothetical protein
VHAVRTARRGIALAVAVRDVILVATNAAAPTDALLLP